MNAPKIPQLRPAAVAQNGDDFIEDRIDEDLNVALVEMQIAARDDLDELGLDHGPFPVFVPPVARTEDGSRGRLTRVLS
jgi:hypothetical protein